VLFRSASFPVILSKVHILIREIFYEPVYASAPRVLWL
jgi:hypothetical protein